MKKLVVLVALFLGVVGIPTLAHAVPATIPFQGRLTDASGTALNGSYSIQFSLWNALTAGSQLWTETQPTVTVANGLFRVDLGSIAALTPAILSGADVFLQIKVGSDPAMTPRQHFGSTPYAFRAGDSPGVAANHSTSPPGFLATGFFDLCSQTVTFPGPGVALVTTHLAWEVDATAGTGNQSAFGITETSGSFDGQSEYFAIITASAPSGTYNADVSTLVRFYNIPAASTHTYITELNHQTGNFYHHGTYMTVQFIPNAIGTVTPAPPAAPAQVQPSRASTEAQGR